MAWRECASPHDDLVIFRANSIATKVDIRGRGCCCVLRKSDILRVSTNYKNGRRDKRYQGSVNWYAWICRLQGCAIDIDGVGIHVDGLIAYGNGRLLGRAVLAAFWGGARSSVRLPTTKTE